MRYTPEKIIDLKDNEIFVFGSNLLGHHVGGSAKLAFDKFGAVWGVGEGLTGQCYAFPTLDGKYEKRTYKDLTHSVEKLVGNAEKNTDKTFLVTKVGCGIAGYKEEEMIAVFRLYELPVNLVMPKGWTK